MIRTFGIPYESTLRAQQVRVGVCEICKQIYSECSVYPVELIGSPCPGYHGDIEYELCPKCQGDGCDDCFGWGEVRVHTPIIIEDIVWECPDEECDCYFRTFTGLIEHEHSMGY